MEQDNINEYDLCINTDINNMIPIKIKKTIHIGEKIILSKQFNKKLKSQEFEFGKVVDIYHDITNNKSIIFIE